MAWRKCLRTRRFAYLRLSLFFSLAAMDLCKAASTTVVKVVEQCRVSPPTAAVPDTIVPLTFFDVLWLFTGPVKRLFFYQCTTITTAEFLSTQLPALRRSLSLTLQLFFSLAGHLSREDLVTEYADGDSVSLVVAESDDDFAAVMSDGAKDVKLTHPLVPPLPPADARGRCPVLALLFTVFPGAGISLGVTVNHAAADGNSSTRFLKSWAAIHRSGGDPSAVPEAPVYERGALLELEEEKMGILKAAKELAPSPAVEADSKILEKRTVVVAGQPVRATYVLTRDQIESLRDRIMSVTGARPSTFVVACSHVWVCLTKARGHEDGTVYFLFAADCRRRVEPPVSDAYFGSLVSAVVCEASGAELSGAEGLVTASKVIHEGIQTLNQGRAVRGIMELVGKHFASTGGRILSVAGSPRLGVYEANFGWGPPRKVEVISIEESGAMSLAESREGDGGLEIGIAGPVLELERFANFFNVAPKNVQIKK